MLLSYSHEKLLEMDPDDFAEAVKVIMIQERELYKMAIEKLGTQG